MLVLGQGGTGKTALINAVTETFNIEGSKFMLAKTGTTGIAASLIDGSTVHSWAGIGRNVLGGKSSTGSAIAGGKRTQNKRSKNMADVEYLFIDECSLVTRKMLAVLSEIIAKTRANSGLGSSTKPFGGMNVILFGDFHQFPPIAGEWDALYCTGEENERSIAGRAIYEQFQTVIILKEQMRVVDEVWLAVLTRLRTGDCTEEDLNVIRGLSLDQGGGEGIDWDAGPWKVSTERGK